MNAIERHFCKFMFGNKVRITMYENLASFVEQGTPLSELLDDLAGSYKKQSPRDIRVKILQEWTDNLRKGDRFSDAIADWVPASECMLIRAGEQAGDPVKGFRSAVLATGGVSQMAASLRKSLAYPGFLFVALIGFIYFFSTNVIPPLAQTMNPDTWRGSARVLYLTSIAVSEYGLWILAAIIGVISGVVYSMPRWTGDFRDRIDSFPPYSIYRTVQGSVFLISLASMMQSGTPIVTAISGLRDLSTRYTSNHLSRMNKRLDAGRGIGDSMNTGLFAGDLQTQVDIYGKLADFDSKLATLGKNAISDGVKQIEGISGVIGQIIIALLGTYIGWVFTTFMGLVQNVTDAAAI